MVQYKELVAEAIARLADRTGSSQMAIEKYIMMNYPEIAYNRAHLRMSLKRGVESGRIQRHHIHTNSYKLPAGEAPKLLKKLDAAAEAKKPAKKSRKAPAKKTTGKKATPKKATGKKSTAKKTTGKKATPKKSTAKKTTGKKSTAKKTTGKKSTAKKTTGRKSTAKKTTGRRSRK